MMNLRYHISRDPIVDLLVDLLFGGFYGIYWLGKIIETKV